METKSAPAQRAAGIRGVGSSSVLRSDCRAVFKRLYRFSNTNGGLSNRKAAEQFYFLGSWLPGDIVDDFTLSTRD
jgi:hypothetical protein